MEVDSHIHLLFMFLLQLFDMTVIILCITLYVGTSHSGY